MKTIIYSDINIPFGISKQLTFSEIALLKNIVLGNIDFFKNESTNKLYDICFEYFIEDMPYGIAKARTGDPDKWILNQLNS